jgi:hypothetical protein
MDSREELCLRIWKFRGKMAAAVGQDCEDLLQDACVAVLESARKVEIKYPKTYAYGTLQHTLFTSYNRGRSLKRGGHPRNHVGLEEADHVAANAEEPDYIRMARKACTLIRAVPKPKSRTERLGIHIILSILEGSDRDSLVEVIGENVYRNALSRTIPRLRKVLAQEGTKVLSQLM